MDLQKKIRKNQNRMVILGNSLRFFGCWVFLKSLLYITMNNSIVAEAVNKVESKTLNNSTLLFIGEIFALTILGLYALINLYAAKCAIDEGKNIKRHKTFLIIIIFILIINVINVNVDLNTRYWISIVDVIISLLTDIANLIVVIQLIYSTIFLRRHTIKLN